MTDLRSHAPATGRNREAILAVLRTTLPATGTVLEIASGSGEHAIHFAAALPALRWQPSEPSPRARASIEAWSAGAGLANLLPPLGIDVALSGWADELADRPDAIVCINMIHIAPWTACVGLLDGAAQLLAPGAPLYLYGPYVVDGETAPSNRAFDTTLRETDPSWGVRELRDVAAAAEARGFGAAAITTMPANNLSVVLRRR